MRERIKILTVDRIADAGGGYSEQMTERRTVIARSETVRPRLDKTAARFRQLERRRFLIRYDASLSYEDRVEHRGTTYRLIDIQQEDDRRRLQLITAEELAR